MSLSHQERVVYIETAKALKGSERRLFMARVVTMFGPGGQRLAERELGWNRGTIRKGLRELERGRPFRDRFSQRGRKRAEEKLPQLLGDLREIMQGLLQTDQTYLATRYYIGVSVAQVRKQLIDQKGYSDKELPSNETLRVKIKKLQYHLKPPRK